MSKKTLSPELAFAGFMHAIYNARKRAGLKGQRCDLSADVARQLWARCGGRCELTGIEFEFEHHGSNLRRPFAPSIDRLENSKGYEISNVRVVCAAVNVAMNQWGEAVLYRIAEGLAQDRAAWRKNMVKYAGKLPRGVKVHSVTLQGPMYTGSKYVSGIRMYTQSFPDPRQALDALNRNDFTKRRNVIRPKAGPKAEESQK